MEVILLLVAEMVIYQIYYVWHIRCSYVVIKDGCPAQPCVSTLTALGRKLVGHYNHSNLACEALQKIQEQLGCPQHRLIR